MPVNVTGADGGLYFDAAIDDSTIDDTLNDIELKIQGVANTTTKAFQQQGETLKKSMADVAANTQAQVLGVTQSINQISDAEKQLLQQQKEAAQYFQSQGGKLNFAKPEGVNLSLDDILGSNTASSFNQAKQLFASLDDSSKVFINNLTQLRSALANTQEATAQLNAQNKSGVIAEQDYSRSSSFLTEQTNSLTRSIDNLIAAQKQYDEVKGTLSSLQQQLANTSPNAQGYTELLQQVTALDQKLKEIAGINNELHFNADFDTSKLNTSLQTSADKFTFLKNVGADAINQLLSEYTRLQQEASTIQASLNNATDPKAITDYNVQLSDTQTRMQGIADAIKLISADPIKEVNKAFGDTKQAEGIFNALSSGNQLFVSTLADLKTSLIQTEQAQQQVNKQNEAGSLTAKEYADATSILKTKHDILSASIQKLVDTQNNYTTESNQLVLSINERSAALENLRNQYAGLADADKTSKIGEHLQTDIRAANTDLQNLTDKLNTLKQNTSLNTSVTQIVNETQNQLNGLSKNIDSVTGSEKNLLQQQIEAANFYKTQGGASPALNNITSSVNVADILGPDYKAALADAKNGIAGLDDETKAFITNLTSLKSALGTNLTSQDALNKSNNAGAVNAKDYAEQTAFLINQQNSLTASIDNLVSAQKVYDTVTNNLTSTYNKNTALLEEYENKLASLTAAEKADPNVGGALKQQVDALQASINNLNPNNVQTVIEELKSSVTELQQVQTQLKTTGETDPGFAALTQKANTLKQTLQNVLGNVHLDTDLDLSKLSESLTAASSKFSTLGSVGSSVLTHLLSSYQKLQAQSSGLQDALKIATNPADIQKFNTQLDVTKAGMNALSNVLKEITSKPIDTVNSAITTTTKVTQSAFYQLRQLKSQLADLEQSGQQGTPQYNTILQQATQLEHALGNVNTQLKLASSNTAGITALGDATQGVLGGFTALQGVMALLDNDDSHFAELIKNTTAAMAILQGVQQLGQVLAKESPLNNYIKQIFSLNTAVKTETATQETSNEVQKLSNIQAEESIGADAAQVESKALLNTATETQTALTEGATVAQEGLNIAMLANPAAIVLGAIAALAIGYEVYERTLGELTDVEKQRKAAADALVEAEKNSADAVAKEETSLQSLLITAKDKTLTDQQRQDSLNKLIQSYPEYLSSLNLDNVSTQRSSDLIAKQIDLIKQRALVQAAQDVYTEKLKAQIDAQNKLNDVQQNGAGVGQKAIELFKSLSGSTGNLTLEQAVLADKMQDVQDATDAANGALNTMIGVTGKLNDTMAGATEELPKYFTQFNQFANSFGKLPIAGPKIFAFNTDQFNSDKNAAIKSAQDLADIAIEGTQNQLQKQKELILTQQYYLQEEALQQGLKMNKIQQQQYDEFGKQLVELNNQINSLIAKQNEEAANAYLLQLKNQGKQYTQAYYDAQKAVNAATQNSAIAQNPYDQNAINLATQQRIAANKQVDIQQKVDALNNQKDIIDAQLQMTEAGSLKELQLKTDFLKTEAQIEVVQAQDNTAKIQDIYAKRNKSIFDNTIQYNADTAKSFINSQLANIDAQLAVAKQGSQEELNLKKQRIDQENAMLNISDEAQMEKQLKSAKDIEAKKAANDALAAIAKNKLQDDYNKKWLESELELIQHSQDAQIAADEAIINSYTSTLNQKYQAQVDEYNREIALVQQQIGLIATTAAFGIIDSKDAQSKIAALEKQIDELKAKLKDLNIQFPIASLEDVSQKAGDISNAFGTLAGAVEKTNPELSVLLKLLSSIASEASSVAKSFADFESGNIAGGIAEAANVATTLIQNINKGLTDLQNGNTGAGILHLYGPIGSFFGDILDQAKASAKEADAELQKYNDSLISGAVDYNELLRQRARDQKDINDLTVQELNTRQQMLELQKQQAEADYNTLLKQIQAQGQQVTGEHTEKTGGFLGIGKKTKVVQDLAGLSNTDYDNLEKLFTEGKLDEKTAAWFQELQKVHDELDSIGQSAQDTADALNQALTGTTADSITDSIIQGFANGKSAVSDFTSDFQSLMKNAILQSLKYNALQKPIQDFYNLFAADAASSQGLNQDTITDLQNKYNSIIQNASNQFKQLQDITKLNFSDDQSSSPNSLQGAIKGITEQTAELLAGQFGGLRITNQQMLQIATQQLNQIVMIVNYTSALPNMLEILRAINNNGIKIR